MEYKVLSPRRTILCLLGIALFLLIIPGRNTAWAIEDNTGGSSQLNSPTVVGNNDGWNNSSNDDVANGAPIQGFQSGSNESNLIDGEASQVVSQDVGSKLDAAGSTTAVTDENAAMSKLAQNASTAKGIEEMPETSTTALSNSREAIAETVVADGTYVIRSSLADCSVLDVAGGSAISGANVQLYSYNGTKAQLWAVALDTNTGFYTIANQISGKVLDVLGASNSEGTNVQVYESNGTKAQQWRLVADGAGWHFESAVQEGLFLDVSGGSSSDCTNVQVWRSNNTAAQLFYLIPISSSAVSVSTADVAEGAYVIRSASGKVVEIAGGSRGVSANVQQYAANSTYAQRFYFEPDGEGYYRIFNVGSGLALDVYAGDVMPGANVQQYLANDTKAQLWSIMANSDGTVTFLSCVSGMALDVLGASSADGVNVMVYQPNGTKAQRFTLESTSLISPDGAVSIYSAAATSYVFDVPRASSESDVVLQLCSYNATTAQRFIVEASSDGAVVFQPVCSGLYLNASSTGALVQSSSSGAWTVTFAASGSRRGVVLTLVNDGRVITTSSTAQASSLKLASPNGSVSQTFLLAMANPIKDGYYIIHASDGRVLDISGGSFAEGANVQVYEKNGTGAQVFLIEAVGTDMCRIVSSKTYQVLDAMSGSTAENTNIWQYSVNGTDAQLWRMTTDDEGKAVFTNVNSGKVLTMSGNNVCLQSSKGIAAQEWTLEVASRYSVTGDVELDKAVARILSTHTTLDSAFYYVAYNYSYRSGDRYWSGWSLSDDVSRSYALEMCNYGSGNCYRFASLFAWCARALGYTDVVVRIGWVQAYSGGQAPHGWVTVNGYVCDPEEQHAAPGYNWYWQTYSSSPTVYYNW